MAAPASPAATAEATHPSEIDEEKRSPLTRSCGSAPPSWRHSIPQQKRARLPARSRAVLRLRLSWRRRLSPNAGPRER